jgi:hypothetical protein
LKPNINTEQKEPVILKENKKEKERTDIEEAIYFKRFTSKFIINIELTDEQCHMHSEHMYIARPWCNPEHGHRERERTY